MSKVLNTWSQNSSAFPDGKNILYISTNLAGVNLPFGQSCCKKKTHNQYPECFIQAYIFGEKNSLKILQFNHLLENISVYKHFIILNALFDTKNKYFRLTHINFLFIK